MSAYEKYLEKVDRARAIGFTDEQICLELEREKSTIQPRAMMKMATLVMEKTPYKRREAGRAAHECITAIERILKELKEKKPCEN